MVSVRVVASEMVNFGSEAIYGIRMNLQPMPIAGRSRFATSVLIANIAIPTVLIVLVLLVGGLITGGILFGLVYLFRRRSDRSEERTDR